MLPAKTESEMVLILDQQVLLYIWQKPNRPNLMPGHADVSLQQRSGSCDVQIKQLKGQYLTSDQKDGRKDKMADFSTDHIRHREAFGSTQWLTMKMGRRFLCSKLVIRRP